MNTIFPWLALYTIVCLILLFFPLRFLWHIRRCTEELSGKVVGLEEVWRPRGGSLFRMQIAYEWEGQQYYNVTWGKYRYEACAARDTITIWIDPAHPAHFKAAGEMSWAKREIVADGVLLLLLALLFGMGAVESEKNKSRRALQKQVDEIMKAGDYDALETLFTYTTIHP